MDGLLQQALENDGMVGFLMNHTSQLDKSRIAIFCWGLSNNRNLVLWDNRHLTPTGGIQSSYDVPFIMVSYITKQYNDTNDLGSNKMV